MSKEPEGENNQTQSQEDGHTPPVRYRPNSYPKREEGQNLEDDADEDIKLVLNALEKAVAWWRARRRWDANKWTALGTWLAVGAATVYAGLAYRQVCEMQETNRIARTAMVAQNRAWVEIQAVIKGVFPVKNERTGSTGVSLNLTLTERNYGNYPAGIIAVQFSPSHSASFPSREVEELCQQLESRKRLAFDTLYPGKEGEKTSSVTNPIQVQSPYPDPQWLMIAMAYEDWADQPIRKVLTLYTISWNRPKDVNGIPQPSVPMLELFDTNQECESQ